MGASSGIIRPKDWIEPWKESTTNTSHGGGAYDLRALWVHDVTFGIKFVAVYRGFTMACLPSICHGP